MSTKESKLPQQLSKYLCGKIKISLNMNENEEGIYIWGVGDIAVAWLSKTTYAKVRVVKDNRGRFHGDKEFYPVSLYESDDEKEYDESESELDESDSEYGITMDSFGKYIKNSFIGITVEKDGSSTAKTELCYFVETVCTRQRLWVPWTAMRLAERCRPFYGPKDKKAKPNKVAIVAKPPGNGHAKKLILNFDPLLPFNVKPDHYKKPEFNAQYELEHQPLRQGKYENSFREFVRRGKEMFFDSCYKMLMRDHDTLNSRDTLDYLLNVDASTEDKFELVIKDIMTEREIEDYLHQCWRYHFVHKQLPMNVEGDHGEGSSGTVARKIAPISWCLVCGGAEGRLRVCPRCPACYHLACRKHWLVNIIHRKNPPKKTPYKEALLKTRMLSSTRTVQVTTTNLTENLQSVAPCPSCMWGPKPGYDDVVWHKLGPCPWWPARVLTPGDTPPCLLSRSHHPRDYPLRYYGTLNHSWASSSHMVLFLPTHAAAARDPALAQAVMDAADDYISVYLT